MSKWEQYFGRVVSKFSSKFDQNVVFGTKRKRRRKNLKRFPNRLSCSSFLRNFFLCFFPIKNRISSLSNLVLSGSEAKKEMGKQEYDGVLNTLIIYLQEPEMIALNKNPLINCRLVVAPSHYPLHRSRWHFRTLDLKSPFR